VRNGLLTFKCKACGEKYSHIEEIMIDCVGSSLVKSIDEECGRGNLMTYNSQAVVDEGTLSHYQCSECGTVIGKTQEEVVEWMKTQDIN